MCWVMPPASPAIDVGGADGVEQLGLAVVDVAHDGDDRGTRDQVGLAALVLAELQVEGAQQLAVLVLGGDDLDVEVQLLAQQAQRVVVDRLGGREHLAELEHHGHEVGRRGVDPLGEVGQRGAAGQPDDRAVAARAAERRRSTAPPCCRTLGAWPSWTCGRGSGDRRAGRTRRPCHRDPGHRRDDRQGRRRAPTAGPPPGGTAGTTRPARRRHRKPPPGTAGAEPTGAAGPPGRVPAAGTAGASPRAGAAGAARVHPGRAPTAGRAGRGGMEPGLGRGPPGPPASPGAAGRDRPDRPERAARAPGRGPCPEPVNGLLPGRGAGVGRPMPEPP